MLTAFALTGLAAAQDTTTTETVTTVETTAVETTAADTATMSAGESFAKAQEYATQADVAYPVSFYDRTLWKAAVDSAYAASTADDANRDYGAYLAQLYTKTQWWVNAYTAWGKLSDLNDQEKQWAALSATKLAYMALQRGDNEAARGYIEQGQSWADNDTLKALTKRLN